MDSTKSVNEYTIMVEYDFSKPINAAITFDSDEDESNREINPVVPENKKNDDLIAPKSLDMPCIDCQDSTTEKKLDDLVTGMIKKYVYEMKNNNGSDKIPPKRKSSTTCEKIKNKAKIKPNHNNMKEIRKQHKDYEPASRSSNDRKEGQLGPPINVSKDTRNQNNCNSNSPTNTANGQSKSISTEPKSEHNIQELEISGQRKPSTSSLSSCADSQTVSICADQRIDPLQNSWTHLNIVSDGIGNSLDTNSSSSSPSNAYNTPPIYARIELKTEIIKDSNSQNNSSSEITSQNHIFSTSTVSPITDNRQSSSASIEQRVGHSWTSANDVSEELRNGIDKVGDQRNTLSVPPNTDGSYTLTNVPKVICDQHNTSSSSLPTNTNNIQPVSTDVTSNIQTQQNIDNSVTYGHLKPLLDTVSEHLVLIWNRLHSWHGSVKDTFVQNVRSNEEFKKRLHNYKLRLFDLSYSTVVNIILPRANNKQFVKDFIDNTVAFSKSESRQTTKEISYLYLEMIHWTQKMKEQIASESVFGQEFMRQPLAPTATNTTGLLEIGKDSMNPHFTNSHSCIVRTAGTIRPPPWIPRSNPPPPYTNNLLAPLHTNNLPPPYDKISPSLYTSNIHPQYITTMPPQTYINNVKTPEQNKAMNTYSEQKKKGRSNQNHNVNVSSSHLSGTYHYQPTYLTALPTPNQAQTAHCTNDNISTNSNQYSRATPESEFQKFLSAFTPRTSPTKNISIQNQNHSNRANDASSQGINNYPNNACLNQANSNQQESDRSSISRDSGFYSPRDFEQGPSTSPLITHVTSLHPDAVNIINGSCYVCGKPTNKKCVGCYAVYYCSHGCQNFDWRNHMAYCNTNQEIRRLLSK